MTTDAPSTAESLSAFASAATAAAERRAALTALITAKVLPKQADDPTVAQGRAHLLALIFAQNAAPEHRLLAIAECIRLGQVVKRWAPEIAQQLRPAFAQELPAMQLLTDADDRLNLARACALMSAAWLPAYLAKAIAEEETGEKARTEMMAALLARSPDLATALRELANAFQALRRAAAGQRPADDPGRGQDRGQRRQGVRRLRAEPHQGRHRGAAADPSPRQVGAPPEVR